MKFKITQYKFLLVKNVIKLPILEQSRTELN